MFDLWKHARNQHYPGDPVPESLLTSCDPVLLNTHLARFAVEVRKTNGDYYPPATVYHLLCGLLRHMREHTAGCPNFLDKKDSRFQQLHGTQMYDCGVPEKIIQERTGHRSLEALRMYE